MFLCRLSFLVIAAIGVGDWSHGQQSDRADAQPISIQAAGIPPRIILTASSPSQPRRISAFLPWRYRLKSVREGGDFRVVQEFDLGTLPVPECFVCSEARTDRSNSFRSIVPLRC
jgi:hypothetical protein